MKGGLSWVTLALNDSEAWGATVLAQSIRKTVSKWKLTIVITENVSQPLTILLRRQFDWVVRMNSSEVSRKGLEKTWLWNLKGWSKCVYLEPYSIFLENSDDLFGKDGFSATDDFSTFAFNPSIETFETLLELSGKTKGDISDLLKIHFNQELENPKHYIPNTAAGDLMQLIKNDVSTTGILSFGNEPWKLASKDQLIQELVYSWVTLFVHEIIPLIKKMKVHDRKFLMSSINKNNLPCTNGPASIEVATEVPEELRDAIAIIGLSCRFPGADNTDEFWDILINGRDPISRFPLNRPKFVPTGVKADEKYEAGFLKCPVDEFDAKFFGISPREAPFVDPQQRLLLEVIWESLENAGINPQSLKESNTGVFVGIWQQDYDRMLPNLGLSANDFHHRYLGNAFSATASRISYFLGLFGPNYSIESGCSSSSSACHLACESLRRGETNIAIASGVNLFLHNLNPLAGDDQNAVVLSPDFRCKTFDKSANGFVRAEGCGAVVLKPYVDAVRSRDNICGIIRGTALNNDGPGTSFGTPNAKAQERVFREALAQAQVKPHEVSFVEAHGTGTIVGDPIEMYAIGQVYSECRKEPLYVGSVKTNIGHSESCAGIAGLIKVILSMKHRTIPPHLHFQTLNPRINLEMIPAKIPLEPTPWVPESKSRIAAVSSFSMSGTNVHIIVQEPPVNHSSVSRRILQQLITLSAKSEEALGSLIESYIGYFEKNKHLNIEDVAYTLNNGRANMSYRMAVLARDTEQFLGKLQKGGSITGKAATTKQKIAFLFTGQGSQYIGMAKNLYSTSGAFKIALDRVDTLYKNYLDISLKEVIWNRGEELDKTIYCQPAIFCTQYALLKTWESFGVKPDVVLGHSVGEFCAAVAAGVLSLDDAMKLVVGRSKLVDSLPKGAMLAVKTNSRATRRLITEFSSKEIDIAAENSDDEVVVSGSVDLINKFNEFCGSRKVKTQTVPATHAFHSRQMDAVLDKFGDVAKLVKASSPNVKYISGTLAREMKVEDFEPSYWQRHLRDTVRFHEALKVVWEAQEGRIYLEVGTQPILLGLALANIPETSTGTFCPSLRKAEEDTTSILNSVAKLYVAGVDIDWKRWIGTRNKLQLPTYPFQRTKYWYEFDPNAHLGASVIGTPLLHPLVGRQLPCSISDTIFAQTLNRKEVSYVEDHKVAERIILPAAAYLETIMAAGCHVLQGGRVNVPFSVENFQIEAAMELDKPLTVQTLVHTVSGEGGVKFDISINRQVNKEVADDWKKHAKGSFSPSTVANSELIDLHEIQERLRLKESMTKAYETIAKLGIEFGPKFQSIHRAWSGETEVLTEILLPEKSDEYICHPIILDAMIQTSAFRLALSATDNTELRLQLPISIKKFAWLCREYSPVLYAYMKCNQTESTAIITLHNEKGDTMAIMEGLELIPTTVASFLRILNAEANPLPNFIDETWRPTSGITRSRIDANMISWTRDSKYTKICRDNHDHYEATDYKAHRHIERLFVLFLLRGIREAHWPIPEVGTTIVAHDWGKHAPAALKIPQTNAFMNVFTKHGYLEKLESSFVVRERFPSLDEIEKEISERFKLAADIIGEEETFYQYTKRCGQHLSSVLVGKMSPLAYLFPSEPHEVGAIKFYTESKAYKNSSNVSTSTLVDHVLSASSSGVVRILEIGAGSGSSSKDIIDHLVSAGVPFSYTFTDISPIFLQEAAPKFPNNVIFEVLNIEEDPLTQGFIPENYDFILASNVIHATRSLEESLLNMHTLLRPNGTLILAEFFGDIEYITLSFGFLDGYWSFKDFREDGPFASEEEWRKCLENTGYKVKEIFGTENKELGAIAATKEKLILQNLNESNHNWFIFTDESQFEYMITEKLLQVKRNVIKGDLLDGTLPENLEGIIFFSTKIDSEFVVNTNQASKLLKLLQVVVSTYTNIKVKPRIICFTRGVSYLSDAGSGNPNAATLNAILRCFVNENTEYTATIIDIDQDELDNEREADEAFGCLWPKDREMFKAIRQDKIFIQRLVNNDVKKIPLPLPNSPRFSLINPASKSIADIEFGVASAVNPKPDEVEVAIRATALNFRDLFLILRPEGFDIPEYVGKDPGLDIAGVISAVGENVTKYRVGDEVFGFTKNGGLASHVVVSENAVIKKPAGMTFSSAATIPVPFLTVFYSFMQCAKLQKGDRVLIHVATGGVGLAAIQVAKHVGAEIYATAGSRRKRAYLRSLGIKYIYHSRKTDFGEEILRDTESQGVNVILNSLTGPGFKEASLKACSKNGRFVEIGKINIWTEEELKALRPDVEYFIVELAEMSHHQPEELNNHIKTMNEEFQTGIYKGLPHVTFPLDLIREAFHYFQEAKHIGKIVVNIPQAIISPEGKMQFLHAIFNKQATYLITGGLGGLGLEVTKWMLNSGAVNIVLSSRNPPNEKATEIISKLRESGARVEVIQADVGNYNECENLLQQIQRINMPPLRGIMHAAGVLSDATVVNQTWDKFEEVFHPKIRGTWNLHELTLGYELEFFAMFSSMTALVGMPGQSNHAAANRFLDSFVHYRLSLGLPALTMNFGAWSDIGVAANVKIFQEGYFGYRAFTPKQGIDSIEKIFRENNAQTGIVGNPDWAIMKQMSGLGHYLDEMRSEGESLSEGTVAKYKALAEEIKNTPPHERQAKIEDFLEKILKETLRIPENESLDRDQNFSEIGVDSLMAMEMKNRLQGVLGEKQLTVSALQENRTIRSLSAHMAHLMNSDSPDTASIDLPTLIKSDCELPSEIMATQIPALKPSDIRNILLTGGTGHLGIYFIRSIQKQNQDIVLHCLVRGKDDSEASTRLIQTAERYSLANDIDFTKVKIYAGDTTKDNFGMETLLYENLCTEVDSIVHCSVKSNHLAEYAEGGDSSIRVQNVVSTKNVLKFAASERTKPVLYASSLIAITKASEDGSLSEDFPEEDDFGDQVKNGYALSKFVCEKLMKEANARGIPATVVRYASLFGDSQTGYMPQGRNHAWSILLTCLRVRKFPQVDEQGIPIMGVDTAANISTKILFTDTTQGGVFNLSAGKATSMSESEVQEVFLEYGVDGEFIPLNEWKDIVFEESDIGNSELSIWKNLYDDNNEGSYINLHPLAPHLLTLQRNELSEKIRNKVPGISDELVPVKILLRRHLQSHYNSLTKQK